MSIQRSLEKKLGPNRKFVKNLKRLSKNVIYLTLEQTILCQKFGSIEISRMKKIFHFKFGL